jgi:hypothetical protein
MIVIRIDHVSHCRPREKKKWRTIELRSSAVGSCVAAATYCRRTQIAAGRVEYLCLWRFLPRLYVPGQRGSRMQHLSRRWYVETPSFLLKCLAEFIRHACGPFPTGVLTRQGFCYSLSCSKHIVRESKSRLPCHVCIATDAQVEIALSSVDKKRNLFPFSWSIRDNIKVSDYLTKNYRKAEKKNRESTADVFRVCSNNKINTCLSDNIH